MGVAEITLLSVVPSWSSTSAKGELLVRLTIGPALLAAPTAGLWYLLGGVE
jgi:hypothetical protein